MKRKKLPIGIQTFSQIREEGYYYVDKTPHIERLINEGKHYFLSRPRRFGKSLLIDTLDELFSANEALFKGLSIHDRWDWSVRYPVVRFSFADGVLGSPKALEQHIRAQLQSLQDQLGVRCESPWDEAVATCFGRLLQLAHRQSGKRVAVLIDEYDKPILDNLGDRELAREMRDGLRDLYSVIKGHDADVQFTLITGVSKFSKVSLFSGLNNLKDITLHAPFSSLCGYTENDLDVVFAPELEGLDREKLRRWYNGYNWLGEAVYNPFDLLLLFDARQYRPWWFETGSPTFLIDLLMERQVFTPELTQLQTDLTLLSSFDVDYIATEALLFQAGYLTIHDTVERGERTTYTLGYPNQEVSMVLNEILAKTMTGDRQKQLHTSNRLYDLLEANDFPAMQQLFTTLFASIPHSWSDRHSAKAPNLSDYEGYYASVFYSHFAALGLDITCEDITCKGRIDMTVAFNDQYYLFEFKVVEESPQGKALAQLKERNYAAKYQGQGKPIHLIGIEFSKESKTVTGFETETQS
jgi:hypothetical protein